MYNKMTGLLMIGLSQVTEAKRHSRWGRENVGWKKILKGYGPPFCFYKSIPRHRAIKLNNRPINTFSIRNPR